MITPTHAKMHIKDEDSNPQLKVYIIIQGCDVDLEINCHLHEEIKQLEKKVEQLMNLSNHRGVILTYNRRPLISHKKLRDYNITSGTVLLCSVYQKTNILYVIFFKILIFCFYFFYPKIAGRSQNKIKEAKASQLRRIRQRAKEMRGILPDQYLTTEDFCRFLKIKDREKNGDYHHQSTALNFSGSDYCQCYLLNIQGVSEASSLESLKDNKSLEVKAISDANSALVTFSKDGKSVISVCWDGSIKIYDAYTKDLTCCEKYGSLDVKGSVVGNERFIVTTSADSTTKFYSLSERKYVNLWREIMENDDIYRSVSSGYKEYFTLGATDSSLFSVRRFAISRDGRFLVLAFGLASFATYDIEKKRFHQIYENVHSEYLKLIEISADNRFIICAFDDASIKIFDAESREQAHHIRKLGSEFYDLLEPVTSIAISTGSKLMAFASKDQSIQVREVRTNKLTHHFMNVHSSLLIHSPKFNNFIDFITSIAISPDNSLIISRSEDDSVGFTPLLAANERLYYWNHNQKGFETSQNFNSLKSALNEDIVHSSNITSLERLNIYPHYLNISHLYTITRPGMILHPSLSYSNFKVPFLVDIYNKTPLHYLIGRAELEYAHINTMLEYILDYLEDTKSRSSLTIRKTMMSLTSLFSFIVTKVSPRLRDRFLDLCYQRPDCEYQLPKYGYHDTNYTFNSLPIVDRRIQNRIHTPGQDQMIFRTTLTYFDYNPTSNDMLKLISTLNTVKSEDIFRSAIVSKIIDHLWNTTKHTFRVCIFIYSAFMILFSIYVIIGKRDLALEISITCLAFLLMVGELLQIQTLKAKYFCDMWSLIDGSQIILVIALMSLKFGSQFNETTGQINNDYGILAQHWLTSLIVLGGYIRWVSYLRYFKSTRNLIQTIISIIKDMYGFIIILIFIFIGFTLIFMEFNRDQKYGDQLHATYHVLYGNIDDDNFSFSQRVFAALILFLLNVVLLNLLISIMADTYDKVQERRVLTDSLTRLELIFEAVTYMRIFSLIRKPVRGYLIYCEPDVSELEEDGDESQWEGRINLIKKKLEENKDDLKKEVTTMKQNIASVEGEVEIMKNELRCMKQELKNEINNNHEEMMNMIKGFLRHSGCMRTDVNDQRASQRKKTL